MHDSAVLWQQLDDQLDGRLEVDLCGGLVVASDDAQLDGLARKAAIDHEFGNPVVLLSRHELRVRASYLSDRMAGGLQRTRRPASSA